MIVLSIRFGDVGTRRLQLRLLLKRSGSSRRKSCLSASQSVFLNPGLTTASRPQLRPLLESWTLHPLSQALHQMPPVISVRPRTRRVKQLPCRPPMWRRLWQKNESSPGQPGGTTRRRKSVKGRGKGKGSGRAGAATLRAAASSATPKQTVSQRVRERMPEPHAGGGSWHPRTHLRQWQYKHQNWWAFQRGAKRWQPQGGQRGMAPPVVPPRRRAAPSSGSRGRNGAGAGAPTGN